MSDNIALHDVYQRYYYVVVQHNDMSIRRLGVRSAMLRASSLIIPTCSAQRSTPIDSGDWAQPSQTLPAAPRYQVPWLRTVDRSGHLWRVAGHGPAGERALSQAAGQVPSGRSEYGVSVGERRCRPGALLLVRVQAVLFSGSSSGSGCRRDRQRHLRKRNQHAADSAVLQS